MILCQDLQSLQEVGGGKEPGTSVRGVRRSDRSGAGACGSAHAGQGDLRGLMLPGGRKGGEPMAARVQPQNVRSAHQSMHHLVADAHWSDQGLLAAVTAQVLPNLLKKDLSCHWIIDDTGFGKKGTHSVWGWDGSTAGGWAIR